MLSQVNTLCGFSVQTLLVALASAGAVTVHKAENSNLAATDSVAQATGFDGFGGFGGFKGFHQFDGLMNNAYGDLEGQFDSTGFNRGFSASSENRKFDTGLLYMILTYRQINPIQRGMIDVIYTISNTFL
jgi:hypothetical protein